MQEIIGRRVLNVPTGIVYVVLLYDRDLETLHLREEYGEGTYNLEINGPGGFVQSGDWQILPDQPGYTSPFIGATHYDPSQPVPPPDEPEIPYDQDHLDYLRNMSFEGFELEPDYEIFEPPGDIFDDELTPIDPPEDGSYFLDGRCPYCYGVKSGVYCPNPDCPHKKFEKGLDNLRDRVDLPPSRIEWDDPRLEPYKKVLEAIE